MMRAPRTCCGTLSQYPLKVRRYGGEGAVRLSLARTEQQDSGTRTHDRPRRCRGSQPGRPRLTGACARREFRSNCGMGPSDRSREFHAGLTARFESALDDSATRRSFDGCSNRSRRADSVRDRDVPGIAMTSGDETRQQCQGLKRLHGLPHPPSNRARESDAPNISLSSASLGGVRCSYRFTTWNVKGYWCPPKATLRCTSCGHLPLNFSTTKRPE